MAYMALLFVLESLISRLVKSSGLSEWNLQAAVYVSICVSVNGVWADSIPLSTCCMPVDMVEFLYKAAQMMC